jgi:hypothetical protein
MKAMHVRLLSQEHDELDTIALDEFAIAEDPEDAPYTGNEEILERVAALYAHVLALLSERQAAPLRGRTWLKLALGEALLTTDQRGGDVVIEVIVRPLKEEEDDDAFPAPIRD